MRHGGFVISAAIDRYVYATISRPFNEGIYLKYAQSEVVQRVDQIQHRIIREALRAENLSTPQIEITTLADIPAGTGLGSSGSFTTALLKALAAFRKRHLSHEELAQLACELEIEKLNEPVGKQDQYIAALGGVTCLTFNQDNTVVAQPLALSVEVMNGLEDNLLLFFTGFSRSASGILQDQNQKSLQHDPVMIQNLHYVKELGYRSKQCLESGDLESFGELMNEHWEHKKERSQGMSNENIDHWYEVARANGAIGGKLVGAGGGGFLMFLARDRDKLRAEMAKLSLEEVRFRFDFEGTKVLISS
jgi:D-glycero-alpha-D-manno-heptose-7-phosphate kinase